jgi:hypothetical protein
MAASMMRATVCTDAAFIFDDGEVREAGEPAGKDQAPKLLDP